MKVYRFTLLVIVVAALQIGFFPAWRPFGIVPDLLVAVIVALSFSTTASETLGCAMIVGLMLDLSSATDFGEHLGFYTVAALGVALLNRLGFIVDSGVWRYGLATLLVIAAHLVVIGGLLIHGVTLPVGIVIGRIVLAIVFELVLMAIVSPIVRRLAGATESYSLRGTV